MRVGAAIAPILNLWPRLALFACWAILLSFVATWEVFSATLNDRLMLETALPGFHHDGGDVRDEPGDHAQPVASARK